MTVSQTSPCERTELSDDHRLADAPRISRAALLEPPVRRSAAEHNAGAPRKPASYLRGAPSTSAASANPEDWSRLGVARRCRPLRLVALGE